jgi:hypothetical protein
MIPPSESTTVTDAVTILAARELRPVVSRSKAARGREFQVLMPPRYLLPPTVIDGRF